MDRELERLDELHAAIEMLDRLLAGQPANMIQRRATQRSNAPANDRETMRPKKPHSKLKDKPKDTK